MEYKELIKNYKGDVIILDNELIKNITLKYYILMKRELNKKISYREMLDIINNVYEITDQYSAEINKFAPCKKGCSYCCNMLVVLSKPEVDLIYQYLIRNFSKVKIQSYENQIKNTLQYVPHRDIILKESKDSIEAFKKYFLRQQTCAFLSEEGFCEIYPVRPFACRTFYVISDVSQCKPNSSKMFIEYKLSIFNEIQNLIKDFNYKVVSSSVGGILGVAPIQEHFKYGINDESTSFSKISKIIFDI